MALHHALLTYGAAEALPSIAAAITAAGGALSVTERIAWSIDDSRALSLEAHRTDVSGKERHFIVVATSLTVEAQNALLKLFEEPPRGVFFHCLFPSGVTLLPTLRSRLQLTTAVLPQADDAVAVALSWLRLPIAEKIAEAESRSKAKDTVWIEAVRQGGLAYLSTRLSVLPAATAQRLVHSLTLLGTRGASNKMLLEDVALSFPLSALSR